MSERRSSEATNKKKSRVKVLALGPLILLVLSTLFTLWLIAPTKVALLTLISRSTSPEISLSFLNLLLDGESDDRYIKLLMAKNIYQMGDILKVINVVEPLLSDVGNKQDWQAHSLYLEAVVAGAYASEVSLNDYSIKKIDLLFKRIQHIPNAKMARKFANVALSFNMPEQALHILMPHLHSGETSHDELVSLALQISDYDSALRLLSASAGFDYDGSAKRGNSDGGDAVIDNNNVQDTLTRLHQIYRWQGNTVKAFEMSLLLTAQDPSEEALRNGVDEAKALGDIYYEGVFYNELANRDQLDTVEYSFWLNALEKSKGTAVALSSVKKLRRQHPNNRRLTIELARLYSYTSNHAKVIAMYDQLKQFGPIDISETRRFANAYIMLNQPQQALNVLTQAKHWLNADDEYLQMVTALAWDLSQKELALSSQDELLERSAKNIDIYRYIRLHTPFSKQDLPQLIRLYEQTSNRALLLAAMNVAYHSTVKNTPTKDGLVVNELGMQALLELALTNDEMKASADVYYYRAMYALQKNNAHDAHRFFRLSLKSDSLFTPTIGSYIWWAIEIQDINTMRELYDTYSVALKDSEELGLTFAALSLQLANYNHASSWYKKYLMEDDKTDITVLIHYASLLTELKLNEKASLLRTYLATLSDDDAFLHSLVSLIAGDGITASYITRKALTQPSESAVSQFFQHQLMAGNHDAIEFWSLRTSLSNDVLPKAKLLAITKNEQELTLDEKLTHSPSSWESTTVNQDEESNAEIIKNYRAALRGQYITNPTWDINTVQVDYYQLADFGSWQLSHYYQTAGSSDVFTGNKIEDEFRLRGLARYQPNRSEWLFDVDLANGVGKQRIGLNVNYSNQFTRYWRVEFGAGINNDIRASQALALAGSDDVISAVFDYQPSYRTSVKLQVNHHHLSTRFDDDIGDGWSGSLRVSEQLFFNSPAWQVYADYSMHEVDLSTDPLLGINDWYQGSNKLTSHDFISPRYQKLSLGQRIYQGDVGVSNQIRQFGFLSKPRYWIDSAVGYNIVTSQPVLSLNLGFGWPILGHDELYFNVDWQSQDRNGEEASRVSIGYFYSF